MCGSDKKSDTPARTPSIPILDPNILHLGSAAKSQLNGGGTGISDLSIGGGKRNLKTRKSTVNPNAKSSLKLSGSDMPSEYRDSAGFDKLQKHISNSGMPGWAKKGMISDVNRQRAEKNPNYEKQLKIKLSE